MNTSDPSSIPEGLPADYHIHTILCKHAEGTPSEYIERARALGLPEVCFTDHCPEPTGYDLRHRMSLEDVPAYHDLISEMEDASGLTLLRGFEADYFPGCEPFLSRFLPSQSLDLVLGSVHYIKGWGFDNPDYLKTWESVDIRGVWKEYFTLLRSLVETRLFDVIGHFDLPKKFGHRLKDRDMKEAVQPLLDVIAKTGMGIEINTSGWRRQVCEAYPSPLILGLACEREIPITFGSDAHTPGEVGFEFRKAVDLARDVGYRDSLRFRKRTGLRVLLPQ